MLKQSLRPWLLALCAVLSPAFLTAGSEGDAKHETPSASRSVPLRLGSVDAVSGDLSLHVPLGARLPGRIPLGFSWSYSYQDAGTHKNGGNFKPVVWPGGSSSPLTVSVVVNGEQWMFYKQAAPAAGAMPTQAELMAVLGALGVDSGQAEADSQHNPNSLITSPIWDYTIAPSTDGTRFFIQSDWKIGATDIHGNDIVKKVAGRLIALDGAQAVWTALQPDLLHFTGVSYFTNRWGDKVSVTETGGGNGAPFSIVIRNERYTSHSITLSLTFSGSAPTFTTYGAAAGSCTVAVTNTLGLPNATMTAAAYTAAVRFSYAPYPNTGNPTGIYDAGVTPTSLAVGPSGEPLVQTSFNWDAPTLPEPRLMGITHPNGLTETFTYDSNTSRLSNDSYDPATGYWWGYKVQELEQCSGDTCTFPLQVMNVEENGGICGIQVSGAGVSQKTVIARMVPTGSKSPTFAWGEKRHITSILHYANASGTGAFRGVRIYHPSVDSWTSGGYTGSAAYLFASSVVVGSETIHGSAVDGTGQPSPGYTVDAVSLSDGWSLKSWANPTGGLGNGLPVNPVARRTRTYAVNLPVKTVIAGINGGEDAFGPTQTDEYTDSNIPSSMPTVDYASAPTWSSSLTLPVGLPIHRNATVHRAQDRSLWYLKMLDDHKTLDGGSLSSLRYDGNVLPTLSGVSSADFGTTTYGYDTSGRVSSVTGQRGAFTATETRSYGLTSPTGAPLPVVTQSVKTLTGYYANPADHTVQVGTAYQYDSSAFAWLTGVKDLADGRWTTYAYDLGNLGRVIQTIDPLQVVTTTDYDSWGRVSVVTRQAKGTVGSVKTEHFYDPNGTWKEDSTTGAGATLTARTEFDAAGRTILEAKYQGYGPGHGGTGTLLASRTTAYDGWGQMTSQSPWLKVGQSAYGTFTWAYDDLGRVTETRDRVGSTGTPAGRILSTVTQQPKWMTATGWADGVSVTGVATTTQDDRGFTRTEVHDLLGQKAGIIDQNGQTSLYYYDKDGHLLQTKQGTQLRSYQYNDMGWLLSRTEPEEGTTSFGSFTMLGTPLVATQTGRDLSRNNTVTTSLDSHLLPWQIVAQGPTGTEGTVTRTLAYDYGTTNTHALQSLSEVQAIPGQPVRTLTETYGYDDLTRLKSKITSDGTQSFTISRMLDDLGNEVSLTYPGTGDKAAQTLTTTYDAQFRPISVGFPGSTRGTMAYDQISGSSITATLTLGNAATTSTTVDNGEVVQVIHSAAAGVLESNAVSWTAGGLMLGRGTDTFTYDKLQRLQTAHVQNPSTLTFVDQTFTYDRYGNRSGVTTSAPAGTLPSPSEALSWTASYDATNSLPTSVNGGALLTGAQYDPLGRMTQVWAIPGQSSSLTQWGYDPSGRVVSETVNGVTTRFMLDGEGLRFKRIAADGTPTYTVYGFHREPLAQYTCPLGQVHSGTKAIQIFHKTSNNSSLSRALGTFNIGDTITATVWFRGAAGTTGEVFLGNVSTTPYTDSQVLKPAGTGAWQQVTLTKTVTVTGPFRIYLYGNTNSTAPDLTSSNYDDVAVSSVQRGSVLSEGFESGLALSTDPNSTTTWYTSGEPLDVDIAGQTGMAEWQKTMVYGFGQLLSEDQLVNGTIYEQSDQVGSPNLITDSGGVVKNRSKNLPFGERLLIPNPASPKSVRRYTNHEDQDGSAIYMQARTYLPAYGKFAQVDPAYDQTKDDPESWNLYNYVTNNPVTHTDPDGREVRVDGLIVNDGAYEFDDPTAGINGSPGDHTPFSGNMYNPALAVQLPTFVGAALNSDGTMTTYWALPGGGGNTQGATPSVQTGAAAEKKSLTLGDANPGSTSIIATSIDGIPISLTYGNGPHASLDITVPGANHQVPLGDMASALKILTALDNVLSNKKFSSDLFKNIKLAGITNIEFVATSATDYFRSAAGTNSNTHSMTIFFNPDGNGQFKNQFGNLFPVSLSERVVHELAHGFLSHSNVDENRVVREWEDRWRTENHGSSLRGTYGPLYW